MVTACWTTAASYSVLLSPFVYDCWSCRADLAIAVDIVFIPDRGACAQTVLLLFNNYYCYRLSSAEERRIRRPFLLLSVGHIFVSIYHNIIIIVLYTSVHYYFSPVTLLTSNTINTNLFIYYSCPAKC